MGAVYESGFYPEQDKSTVRDLFLDEQITDRFENGHCYSGSIGMAEGIEFRDEPKFGSVEEAYPWVEENARKWGPAIAVQIVHPDPNKCGWFYGAICAS